MWNWKRLVILPMSWSLAVLAACNGPTTLPPETPTTISTAPTAMPDLGKVAYIQDGDVWVKELPDGKPQRLTDDGRNTIPRWSPSGEWLAFYKDTEVWLARANGSDVHSLDGRCNPVNALAWSPVEDRLACVAGSGVLRLETVDADGAASSTLIPPSIGASGRLGRIAWSPDGKWIAYEWQEGLMTYQGLWKISADGEERAELYASGVPDKGEAVLAGWSKDGRFLLFWQGDVVSASAMADGLPLLRLPLDGGAPLEVADVTLLHPDFWSESPTDQHVALTVGSGRETWTHKQIALLDLETGSLEHLTEKTVAAFSPVFSPDGQQIAYVAAPDVGYAGGGDPAKAGAAQRRIWVMNADGSNQRPLTDDPAYRDERPLWSVSGTHLLFARVDGDDRVSLWLLDVASDNLEKVVDELGPLPGPTFDWFGYYGHVEWEQLFDWQRDTSERGILAHGQVLV
jgi:dipeptidyl aminopeptidase/acylaminoacyl peptidase